MVLSNELRKETHGYWCPSTSKNINIFMEEIEGKLKNYIVAFEFQMPLYTKLVAFVTKRHQTNATV